MRRSTSGPRDKDMKQSALEVKGHETVSLGGQEVKGHETVSLGGQEVKVQGHTGLKIDCRRGNGILLDCLGLSSCPNYRAVVTSVHCFSYV